jgi:hypothetical protein
MCYQSFSEIRKRLVSKIQFIRPKFDKNRAIMHEST